MSLDVHLTQATIASAQAEITPRASDGVAPNGIDLHPDENTADDWRAESDGLGELLVFCPECWQREFGAGT